jgi:hypothetical protein
MGMDPQAFKLLVDKIDEVKKDLKEDISLLRGEVGEVKKDTEANKQFKWKFSGAMLVFTLMFQGVLAYLSNRFTQGGE